MSCSCHEAGITERQAVSCFLAQQTLLSLVTELGKALCIPYISWAYMDMARFQSPTSTTFRCILLSPNHHQHYHYHYERAFLTASASALQCLIHLAVDGLQEDRGLNFSLATGEHVAAETIQPGELLERKSSTHEQHSWTSIAGSCPQGGHACRGQQPLWRRSSSD